MDRPRRITLCDTMRTAPYSNNLPNAAGDCIINYDNNSDTDSNDSNDENNDSEGDIEIDVETTESEKSGGENE